MDEQHEIMTAQEVAAFLRIERKTVYRLASKLGAFKVGGVFRFKRSLVERYIASQMASISS